MASFMRKYGEETTIVFPVPKLNDTDFAATGDWTPAATDIRITKDAGTLVDCSNTAVAVSGTGSLLWALTLTATEMEAAVVTLQIVDAVLEHDAITIETYGNASAQHAFDLDTAVQDVNLTKISGDTTPAGNLKLQYDTTGLLGDTFPLRQDQGASISGGLAIHTAMASVAVIQGSEQDLANASTSDDTYWTGDDDGSGAEFIFLCTPADSTALPGDLHFEGYYSEPTGATNGATLEIYNFQTASWDSIIAFTNASSDEIHDVSLLHGHSAPTGGTLETVAYSKGDVLIKFLQDTTETGNEVLFIDMMHVGFIGSALTAAAIVNEWETQSQADPTGFHVNVLEVNGIEQTANDNSSDINEILIDTDGTIPGLIAALNNLSAAQVNAEVDDVITTDTGTEEDSVPAAAAGLRAEVQLLYQALRNQLDVTNTAKKVHNNAGAVVGSKALTSVAGTYSEAKMT